MTHTKFLTTKFSRSACNRYWYVINLSCLSHSFVYPLYVLYVMYVCILSVVLGNITYFIDIVIFCLIVYQLIHVKDEDNDCRYHLYDY